MGGPHIMIGRVGRGSLFFSLVGYKSRISTIVRLRA
jgi:hypothetical protein